MSLLEKMERRVFIGVEGVSKSIYEEEKYTKYSRRGILSSCMKKKEYQGHSVYWER